MAMMTTAMTMIVARRMSIAKTWKSIILQPKYQARTSQGDHWLQGKKEVFREVVRFIGAAARASKPSVRPGSLGTWRWDWEEM